MSKKISQLPAVVTPGTADQHEVNQGGVSKRLTSAQLLDLVSTGAYNFSSVGVGPGPGSTLLGDGSAVLAGGGLVIGADGSISNVAGAFQFNADGSGSLTSGLITWNTNGDIAAKSLSINAGVITLGADGVISSNDTVVADVLVKSNGRVAAADHFECNAQAGVTADIVVGAQTLHFEGGILTSVV